ncbi:MAG: hypothetical protein DRJ09_06155 [Bacteroidetes bacterium]|nr:MAG: hypothetical protein DRJ09_06155 [Bacteroidota bacterium]
MNRDILINRTINKITLLPDWRLEEISDYVDFLLKLNNDKEITNDIMKLISSSKSFNFLNNEEDVYDESDLIEKFQ